MTLFPILNIMSKIMTTCLGWGSSPLLKLKKGRKMKETNILRKSQKLNQNKLRISATFCLHKQVQLPEEKVKFSFCEISNIHFMKNITTVSGKKLAFASFKTEEEKISSQMNSF